MVPPDAQEVPGRTGPRPTKRQLQGSVDRFVAYYNEVRPHRGIGRRTPAEVFAARERAYPCGPRIETIGYRVRHDRGSKTGNPTIATGAGSTTSAWVPPTSAGG